LAFALLAAAGIPAMAAPVSGAIFTTDEDCGGVDLNIYSDKDDVYLNGGPHHPGAAGLPDGDYYVQVTSPEGTLLGTPPLDINNLPTTQVHVTDGEFDQCYQLSAILVKASDGTPGYDDTPNNGGEYKAWVSTDPTFVNSSTKTDNFKVRDNGGNPPETATLTVQKFYDANANGVNDGEALLDGWQVTLDDANHISFHSVRYTPVNIILDPGSYIVTESDTIETNWVHTTANAVPVTLAAGETRNVEFGNVCLGAGGGRTLGFWSNKNGQATMAAGPGGMEGELAFLSSLNLRTGLGGDFDPATYASFRSWLLNGNAVNMAYMLSVQLSAMELNVYNGFVSGGALVYAPGAQGAVNGFMTVSALMAEANTELGLHGETFDGSAFRSYQEALKNALDQGNNNLNFVQATACPFSFEAPQ
jgi:hypothetical protein